MSGPGLLKWPMLRFMDLKQSVLMSQVLDRAVQSRPHTSLTTLQRTGTDSLQLKHSGEPALDFTVYLTWSCSQDHEWACPSCVICHVVAWCGKDVLLPSALNTCNRWGTWSIPLPAATLGRRDPLLLMGSTEELTIQIGAQMNQNWGHEKDMAGTDFLIYSVIVGRRKTCPFLLPLPNASS